MTDNPMADFVDVIHARWWQSKTPPIPGHNIGKDLSVIKAWLRRGFEREELLGALDMWTGNPCTLLVFHRRGSNNLMNELIGNWKKAEELKGFKVCNILRQMAEEGRL